MNNTPSSGPVQSEVSLYDRINWGSKFNQDARLNFHTNLHLETKIGIVILTGLIGVTVIGLLAAAPLFKCLTEFSASTKNIFRKDVKKTEQVAQHIFKPNSIPSAPEIPKPPTPEHKIPDSAKKNDNQPVPLKTHKDISNEILSSADKLWEECGANPVQYLLAIRTKFKDHSLSLQNLSDNSLELFFANSHLRLALVSYARTNNLENILNKHLIFISKEIFNNRDNYTAQAIKLAHKKNPNIQTNELNFLITLELYKIIYITLQDEGRSLSEILINEEALNIFKSSGRLALVLSIYIQMKTKNQTKVEDNQEDLNQKRAKDAKDLAKRNAHGKGLVTALGLNEYALNQQQLRSKVLEFLKENSPDKKDNPNIELVQNANQLLELIRYDVYEDYLQELNNLRNKPISHLEPSKDYSSKEQPKINIVDDVD